jgi:hypothetical protein
MAAIVAATLPGAAGATSTTCSTTVVCAEYINTSSGVAIHGEANSGIGVRGTSVSNTGFYGASGSGYFFDPGVEGESTNNSGQDAAAAFGLAGAVTGKPPEYGVLGYGLLYGVLGDAESAGTSAATSGVGVYGDDETSGTYNVGVRAHTKSGFGVEAEANGTPGFLVGSGTPVGVYAVAKGSNGGLSVAIEAEGDTYPLEVRNTTDNSYVEVASSGVLISGYDAKGKGAFTVDSTGHESISGTLTTSGGTYARTTGASGKKRVAYGARTAAPEIEDVGEASMTNGRALVRIDAAFGDSIDMRRTYHVFLTPEGDCKGLYVSQKSPGAFVVRELQGGHSTLTFDYRIVAKPVDENGQRLADLRSDDAIPASGGPVGRVRVAEQPTPEQRLMQRVGMRAYEKAIADLKSRLTAR